MSFIKKKAQAKSLIQTQRIDKARRLLLALYEQNAKDVETWHLLATVSCMLGNFADSEKWSRRVIEKHPNFIDAWMNLATVLQHSDKLEPALDAYQHALQLQPTNVHIQFAIAELYRKLGNLEAALQNYRKAFNLNPNEAALHYNFGTFQEEIGNFQRAEESYLMALKLKPDLVQARNNLGLVYQEQCRLDDAMQCFNEAANIYATQNKGHQDDAVISEFHNRRAFIWLLQGDFGKGWQEYEWRHSDPTAAIKRSYSSPTWDGGSLDDKSILVTNEQGIGDEIMFVSCISDLQKQARQVVLEANPRLEELFRRSFPSILVHAIPPNNTTSDSEELYAIDVNIPAGSLPRYLRKSLGEFAPGAYLSPDPEKVQFWKDRYKQIGNGLNVGVSWLGGRLPRTRRKRSTSLQEWLSVFMLNNIQFINLQYGDCAVELQQLSEQHGITVWDWPDSDPLQNMDDFAAQVAALDLVISVDNTNVHLAGALGVPVWILQTFSPEWRWLLECEDSYWYSGIRQFRQPSIGNWEAVFETVRKALVEQYGVSK